MDFEYKPNKVNSAQKRRLFTDLLIDGIMSRDARFKNRENVFELLQEMDINYSNWYNIGDEVSHFFEVRDIERRVSHG